MIAAQLAVWLIAMNNQPIAYEEVNSLVGGEDFARHDSEEARGRLRSGSALPAGSSLKVRSEDLPPGDYKVRFTAAAKAPQRQGDLSIVVENESTGQQSRFGSVSTEAPRFHLGEQARVCVEIKNTSDGTILVGQVGVLRKQQRSPIQVVMYMPDAYAFFPETHPDGPFAALLPSGTYQRQFHTSGDNTKGFTRSFFERPVVDNFTLGAALKRNRMATAAIGANFYLLEFVEKSGFDFLWIEQSERRKSSEVDSLINARALEWARMHRDEDFFLYVHTNADHDYGYKPRRDTEAEIRKVLSQFRQELPRAMLLLMPDHGPMYQHGWSEGTPFTGGQGWGLYLDTQHIPLLALGPGIIPGRHCDRLWSGDELRDRLAQAGPKGARGLLQALNCAHEESPAVFTEGFATQLSMTDRSFHYVQYQKDVPYPMFSAVTGGLVRDKFLDHEAMFRVADYGNVQDVGSRYPEALIAHRDAVRAEKHR